MKTNPFWMRPNESRWLAGALIISLVSFAFHASFDYLGSARLAVSGVLLLVLQAVWLFYCPALRERDLGKDPETRSLAINVLTIILCVVLVAIYSYRLMAPGPWSEEVWWTEQAREILAGTRIHPIGFKGDHPANFFAWPVAFFLWLTGDGLFSTRLPGIFYALITAWLVGVSGARLTGAPRLLLVVLPALSISSLHFSRSGWNEITAAPILIAFQIYALIALLTDNRQRSLWLLGVAAGLGFSTLYTAFFFSLIIIGFVICMRPAILSWRKKLIILAAFALVAAPTFGKVIKYPHLSLGRHVEWAKGGEWGNHFDSNRQPLPTYVRTSESIVKHIMPSLTASPGRDLMEINLEPTSFVLFIIGFLGLWRVAAVRCSLCTYGGLIGMFLGLVLSNTEVSRWRELSLFPLVMLFVVVGLGLIWRLLSARPHLRTGLIAVVLALHFGFLGERYFGTQWGYFGHEASQRAKDIFDKMASIQPTPKRFYVADSENGLFFRYMRAMNNSGTPLQKLSLKNEGGAQAVEGDSALAIPSLPETQQLSASWDREALEKPELVKKVEVMDPHGRPWGEIYVLSPAS